MSEANLVVLLIEDNAADADLLEEMLAGGENRVQVVRADCMAAAESHLKAGSTGQGAGSAEQGGTPAPRSFDAILLDLGLPDCDGLASLERAAAAAPHLPIVVLTGLEDEALGVQAVRKGAQDYMVKGQATPRLLTRVIRHAIERNRLIEVRSQFLANVSHELRTPMNAILGMIDVALRNELNSTVRDCLNTARESADLLLGLLNNLLDSAKVQSGHLELETAPMSVRQVLDQAARVLAVRARQKGIEFRWQASEDVPRAVLGDKLRLRQVLLNLGGNAVKFTERGEVSVSVRVVERAAEAELGVGSGERVEMWAPRSPLPAPSIHPSVCLEFAVRDTGVGIPRGDLDRIFKPFAQADASNVRRAEGAGLGLAISADLVALMGGRLWAESEAGRGSTFYFTVCLPLAERGAGSGERGVTYVPDSHLPAPSSPLRVLLVEDNPASQKLAAHIFREAGHALDVARDGQQALRMVEQTRYDAVLMDVQMPVMDGLAATAAIRAREEWGAESTEQGAAGSPLQAPRSKLGAPRRVPIIAMTARAMKGDRERCLAAGMDDYVSKPFDAAEILAAIARLTQRVGSRTASPASPAPCSPLPAATDVFDLPAAMERCCGSRAILGELAECVFADDRQLFPLMYAATDSGDFTELGRLAHRMKGTLACLAGQSVMDAAATVDRAAGGCDKDKAREAVRILEEKVGALKAALADFLPQDNAAEEQPAH